MSIDDDIAAAKTHLGTLRTQRSHASVKLANAQAAGANNERIGLLQHKFDMIDARCKAARKVLTELQAQQAQAEEENEMRRDLIDDETPQPVQPSWPWVANERLNIAGVNYNRGMVIPAEVLASVANYDAFRTRVRQVSPEVLKRMQAGRQPPLSPTKPQAAPYVASDPIRECRDALDKMVVHRGLKGRHDAIDLISGDVLGRANKAWSDSPKTIAAGAWGSGGALVQSGLGTARRCSDGFTAFICSDEPLPGSKELAA
jgi:hypothetical protein